MVKIDIISGFLGSGKTTFIKRMTEILTPKDGPLAIIENDFGSVNLDAAYLALSNVRIAELNAGCVCCSLTGRLEESLTELLNQVEPSHIILEPSGVARLSDILQTLRQLPSDLPIIPGSVITLAIPFRSLAQRSRFFGVYKNQLLHANLILPGQLDLMPPEKRLQFLQTLKQDAERIPIWQKPWQETDLKTLLSLGSSSDKNSNIQPPPEIPLPKMRASSHTEFNSLTIDLDGISSSELIRSFLERLLQLPQRYGTLLRAKGFHKTHDGHHIKISLNALNLRFEPVLFPAEEKLILIGSSLNCSRILKLFHEITEQKMQS